MVRVVLLASVLLLGACSAPPVDLASDGPTNATPVAQATPALPTPTSSATPEWREPAAYSFTLQSRCGERGLLGRFHVEVENGTVVAVEGLDEQGRTTAANTPPEAMPTLADLLRLVAQARSNGADEVSLNTDPADGRPISIEIDWLANAIDDEECYTISDFIAAGTASGEPSGVPIPVEFTDRVELPSCGHEVVERTTQGDLHDAEATECFLAAYEAEEPAEFISDSLTPESGRIRTIYRLLASGEVEIFLDTTQDPLSTPEWTRTMCLSIRRIDEDPNGVPIFMGDECDQPTVISD